MAWNIVIDEVGADGSFETGELEVSDLAAIVWALESSGDSWEETAEPVRGLIEVVRRAVKKSQDETGTPAWVLRMAMLNHRKLYGEPPEVIVASPDFYEKLRGRMAFTGVSRPEHEHGEDGGLYFQGVPVRMSPSLYSGFWLQVPDEGG